MDNPVSRVWIVRITIGVSIVLFGLSFYFKALAVRAVESDVISFNLAVARVITAAVFVILCVLTVVQYRWHRGHKGDDVEIE